MDKRGQFRRRNLGHETQGWMDGIRFQRLEGEQKPWRGEGAGNREEKDFGYRKILDFNQY